MRSEIQRALHGVAVLCISAWAGSAIAATAVAPSSGTVACGYYSSPSSSSYLDISNRTCSEWNIRGMLVGTVYYRYQGGCANSCVGGSSCNSGAGNHYVVTGSNGWDVRQLFINSNANAYSKSCDRCALGLVGATGMVTSPLTRADNRQYGVKMTGWISPSLLCGQSISGGEFVGNPTL